MKNYISYINESRINHFDFKYNRKIDKTLRKKLAFYFKNGGEPELLSNDSQNMPFVWYLMINNEYKLLKLFFKNGGEPDKQYRKTYPIFYCATNGKLEIFKLLLDNGSDLNTKKDDSPLMNYILMSHNSNDKKIKMVESLIEHGYDWSIKDINDLTFLDHINAYTFYIITKYPEKYKEYLKQKQVKKFKI